MNYYDKYLKYRKKYITLKEQNKKLIGGEQKIEISDRNILICDIKYHSIEDLNLLLDGHDLNIISIRSKRNEPKTIIIQLESNEIVHRDINKICEIIEKSEKYEEDLRFRVINYIEIYNKSEVDLETIQFKVPIMRYIKKYTKDTFNLVEIMTNNNTYYKFLTSSVENYTKLLLFVFELFIAHERNITDKYCYSPLEDDTLLSEKNKLIADTFPIINSIKNFIDIFIDDYITRLYWRKNFITLKPEYLPGYVYRGGNPYESDKVWPVMSNIFSKNGNILRFCGINNIVIEVNNTIPGQRTSPILGMGSYTAVYSVNYLGRELILRITRKTSMHYLYFKKIKKEYLNYKDNLMEIIMHGNLEATPENVEWVNTDLTERFRITNFSFDYILTKKYYTYSDLPRLTNKGKYIILQNLLILLHNMFNNNEFHCDLKIQNIGFTTSGNIILIDYDQNTIRSIEDAEDFFKYKPGMKYYKEIITTYKPKYVIHDINHSVFDDACKYNMYSIAGLADCIIHLNIKLTDGTLLNSTPIFNKVIKCIYRKDIPPDNELCEYNDYHDFTYDKLLDCLEAFEDQIT
jgi:RIO-like serine/threonine protein kinase